MPLTIHFVRHGHVYNPDNIYYGRLPNFRLSEDGQKQAQAAAQALANAPIVAVYCSPQQRAQETAAYIAKPHQLMPIVDEGLNEVYSPFDGITQEELANVRQFDLYKGAPSPYEQPQDVMARIEDFIARMQQAHDGEEIVAVTHGDPLAFTILYAHGRPVTTEEKGALHKYGVPDGYPQTASIFSLTLDGDKIIQTRYTRPY
ncbi:MAG: histidine phosphatase family protein [Chloroflexi bacterium]|nr:MAG: histidine phosphatase family protein [Chloroflexota bacterium]